MTEQNPAPVLEVAKLPDARKAAGNSGGKCSVACNLPHGLTIHHEGHKLTLHGANHPKAIATGATRSGLWGITHDVPEDWFDDYLRSHAHVDAVRNGHIVKNTKAKIEGHVEAIGDAVKTGVDQVDPDSKEFKAENGVETAEEED